MQERADNYALHTGLHDFFWLIGSLNVVKNMKLLKRMLLSSAILSTTVAGNAQRIFDPAAEAKKQFEVYRPTIEQKEQASVDGAQAYTGDLNGDGLMDCILYFVLTPMGGGNAVVGRKAAVYLNTGSAMKVDGAFPDLSFCYGINRLAKGFIYLDEYECAPPYNHKAATHRYKWQSGKLVTAR